MVIGGMLPPDFKTETKLVEFANDAGLFCSFINLSSYSSYEEALFKDTLKDWGFWVHLTSAQYGLRLNMR